jgi:chemotaxis protein CheD
MTSHAAKLATGAKSARYLDKGADKWVVKVKPGGQHVSCKEKEVIATVLGSCVAACIWDPVVELGGMNHFMLPYDEDGLWSGASRALRYGNHAMDALINEMLAGGAVKRRMQVKFFGGANVMATAAKMGGVGDDNCRFAQEYAVAEKLNVVSTDLGGSRGRRIMFDPVTGKAWRRLIKSTALDEITTQEVSMHKAPPLRKPSENIELF